jgi:acetyl/propionyl-CoA carboxylase alpha subunit/acetyl-CoA carboxylase carboxyltransferase component
VFSRIAVVNRGEPAVRLIRAVRELNAEHGHGIRVIALHTEAERRALFVRSADEAVILTGARPYLDHSALEVALRRSRADAAWVGWGFVAEDPAFAELCARLDITFIGPPAAAMRRLGDKIEAKLLAEETGVPVAPWSGGAVERLEDAQRHAEDIGYPLIIKARSGGGGRGIRIVQAPDELAVAFERTRAEAASTFGDPVVFLERLVTGGRHIEVQVIADEHGAVWTPGIRDCSIQRRNQKLIEESSSPVLTAEQDAELRRGAAALVRAAGYRGAGTVEFLYQPEDRAFSFLEVNTRLQVEHPITEATTGLDLVKLQIHVAAGGRLDGEPPQEVGHAIEARLNAEDAERGFAPAPGAVQLFQVPTGPGIRVDTGVAAGDVIPPDYDSMIAKVIAWGHDRAEALARLRCALRETTVVLRDGTTTKSFLLDLLEHPDVVSGSADTGWLDRIGVGAVQTPGRHADVALLQVAIDVHDTEQIYEREAFLAAARGGRPRASHAIGRTVELGYGGRSYGLVVARLGPNDYRVDTPDCCIDLQVDRFNAFESRLLVGDRGHRVVAAAGPVHHLVEVDGISHRVGLDSSGVVRAPAPAVVVAVHADVGDEVEAGATVAVLESMKMETALQAPHAGVVRDVAVAVGAQIDSGAPILRLDRIDGEEQEQDGPTLTFSLPRSAADDGAGPASRARAQLRALRARVTGYDVSAERADTLLAEHERSRTELPAGDPDLLRQELDLLTAFADVCELSRNRPTEEEEDVDETAHSPREHFHTYLRSLDIEREGLPESFRTKLLRALRHYGVDDVEPGPALEEAVHRLFLAQERAGQQLPVIASLLERWLSAEELLAGAGRDELGEVLERLIVATQLRYPAIGDLARSVRFRLFDEPLIAEAREQAHEEVRAHLAHLIEHPDAPDAEERLEVLTTSPEPLVGVLSERLQESSTGPEPLLEVLTRRYYKIRALEDVRAFQREGRQMVTGRFQLRGQVLYLVSTIAAFAELSAALDAVVAEAADVPDVPNLVIDLYLSWPDAPADVEEMSATLRAALERVPSLRTARRVTVTVCCRGGEKIRQLTFRPAGDGLVEELVIRDMHPLTGQRLDLWRLKEFDGTRLPSPEDTYLFHLVAPDNPADERLVAMAEVRDVTPLRDAGGNVIGFPAAERALAACLDGIRRAQSQRRQTQRLDANRIFLYSWPPIEVPLEELAGFARTAAPLTAGAGLEEILLLARLQDSPSAAPREVALRFSYQPGAGVGIALIDPPTEPLAPLDEYSQQVRRSRARGTVYPYELVPLLTRDEGTFTEHELDADGRLTPVERAPGGNRAAVIAGLVSTPTARHPEGIVRVALFGDPTKALGSVAEPECARIIAAIDLAEELGVPVEWFALSSGARISMDSGTENMDWVSRALRRIITFTQAGGEINVVVAGINVGAQPYWNAEATMLQHTKGILVMTPDSAMVLTGKQSLDYSGGVSAEDNFGIGGYDRVMGPNGQAQYWAPNLSAACDTLFAHYAHTYIAPGEVAPRRAVTEDPVDRDVRSYPHSHPISDFTTVGDIFSAETNPDRKKPFDIRTVMRAVVDQDHAVLERWAGMADAETAVVFDGHLGGFPATILGIESRPVPRRGRLPADGPDTWTAGTLFPRSSKKVARAINAASGNRPLVVLANLSGFDGSPESLRDLQLEYGAEIGRAMVNFDGPIVFCVISRYHGGAFVVFSGALNDNMEVVAVEGSYASVIGGAPAAAVVFARDVAKRTSADPRVRELEAAVAAADEGQQAHLRVELADRRAAVRSEKLGEVAREFEAIHDIERAREVGSVHDIIPAAQLRPFLIGAVERGLRRAGRHPGHD